MKNSSIKKLLKLKGNVILLLKKSIIEKSFQLEEIERNFSEVKVNLSSMTLVLDFSAHVKTELQSSCIFPHHNYVFF